MIDMRVSVDMIPSSLAYGRLTGAIEFTTSQFPDYSRSARDLAGVVGTASSVKQELKKRTKGIREIRIFDRYGEPSRVDFVLNRQCDPVTCAVVSAEYFREVFGAEHVGEVVYYIRLNEVDDYVPLVVGEQTEDNDTADKADDVAVVGRWGDPDTGCLWDDPEGADPEEDEDLGDAPLGAAEPSLYRA